MGLNICPSTPCIVKRGTKAAKMMSVENKIADSTWVALTKISRIFVM